jgi:hypothetical protein
MSKRKASSKKGERKEKKTRGTQELSEITVSSWVSESSVALTGWAPGEYAIGIECKAKTAVAQLADDSLTIGPCKDLLEGLARFPDVEARFLDSLTHLPRFRKGSNGAGPSGACGASLIFACYQVTRHVLNARVGCMSVPSRVSVIWMCGRRAWAS